MGIINFEITLIGNMKDYLQLITDYEKYVTYLPAQIKSVKIIEKSSEYTITEETLHLSNVISKTFIQQTKHYTLKNDILESKILSGPAKNSIIKLKLTDIDSKTIILIEIDVKLALKYKILLPIIKKSYKTFFMGILYKMQSTIASLD
jgi:ribosome-associated toxin RatA of RatAB toxin-antitoxin module|tara:strand:- start:2 stop:445 length:444 start_codon:yes stop_codon:yes gene_type:complete